MTHELKHIIAKAFECFQKGETCVLASVVALDGTSYRKPGVRMLITQNGERVGAVSGGCVERDVQQRAQTVFETGKPLVMAYDGRFRLGCQGTLYLLIEPFQVSDELFNLFLMVWIQPAHSLKLANALLDAVLAPRDRGFGTQIRLEFSQL